MESTLSAKGQATIPKAIRDHLQLKPGDRIKFFKHPEGFVVILPKLPTSRLKGILSKANRKSVSIEEMEDAVAAGAVHRFNGVQR
jgi:antitoxin PrlF